jgi:hypothetical protein
VTTHLVMPLRAGTANEVARFTLRSWHRHHPDLEPVLIGGRPAWFRGRHLATKQREGPAYQWRENFPAAMRATIDHLDGDLWWTADDIFVLRPLDPGALYCREKPLADYARKLATRRTRSTYVRLYTDGIVAQATIVAELRPEVTYNADAHTPHLLNTEHLADLLDLFAARYPGHPAGHFRAVYGALWPRERVDCSPDPKVEQPWDVPRRADLVSLAPATWRAEIGKRLRELFPEPAPWEAKR